MYRLLPWRISLHLPSFRKSKVQRKKISAEETKKEKKSVTVHSSLSVVFHPSWLPSDSLRSTGCFFNWLLCWFCLLNWLSRWRLIRCLLVGWYGRLNVDFGFRCGWNARFGLTCADELAAISTIIYSFHLHLVAAWYGGFHTSAC